MTNDRIFAISIEIRALRADIVEASFCEELMDGEHHGVAQTHDGTKSVVAEAQMAAFTVSSTSGCGSTVIEIDDKSSGSPEKWVWDFGNGVTKNEIRSKSYKFTYLPGTYTITLQVWKGDTFDETSQQITIYSEPEVDFELTSFSGCVNSDAVFTDKSHSEFAIVGYEWHFGDAGLAKVANPVHSYLTEGDYSVSLAVVDANGCSAEKVKNGYVHVTDAMNFSISSL